MNKKYKPIIRDMFEYIRNHVAAEYATDTIVDSVISRFPAYIAYYDCSPEMYKEFITQLCEYAKFVYTNRQ